MTKREVTNRIIAKRHLINDDYQASLLQFKMYDNRLKDISASVKIYAAFLTLPWIAAVLLTVIYVLFFPMTVMAAVLLLIPAVLLALGGLFFFPFSLYYLMRYYAIHQKNKKIDATLFAPPAERNPIDVLNRPSEQTLLNGHRMLQWKLNRYAHFLTEIDDMLAELKGDVSEQRQQEMLAHAESLPRYVEIRCPGDMEKKTETVCLVVTVVLLLLLLALVAYYFIGCVGTVIRNLSAGTSYIDLL